MRTLTSLTSLSALAFATLAVATPAFAQDTTPATPTKTAAADTPAADEIVVTGTMFRRTNTETPSPVTVIGTEEMDKRGISTIQDAIQQLSSNNGPALTNSFSANGAFAAGASAVSLRGLSTNSTLVLFDGLRAAYYPLADDGSRNFVDLNTIPDDIIEKIDVLKDGASSTYGADAIAGVVNIITKKEFKGIGGRAEAGISARGDAPTYRLNLTAGFGDLETNGINAYISGFYYQSALLKNSERPQPYNTDNTSAFDFGNGSHGPNSVINGANIFTGISTGGNLVVRPYNAANTTAQGIFQNLGGCGVGTPRQLNAFERTGSVTPTLANPNPPTVYPATVCTYDQTNLWGVIQPDIKRWGVSAHVAARITDDIEATAEVNYLQSTVSYSGFPATLYGTAPTGIFYPQFRTSGAGGVGTTFAAGSSVLTLPIYVCPRGTTVACTAANGTLNSVNNPFAAAGNVARIFGRFTDRVTQNLTRNKAYRGAFSVHGPITDSLSFDLGVTGMHTDLRRQQDGYVYIQHLLDVINDGSFNFANPSANSQTAWDYLMPRNITNSTSDLYQAQGTLTTSLFDLPGGPVQLGVGGAIRYEAVNAPSGNTDFNGPTQRYFTLNAFGTKGHRTVYSAFAEISAPIVDQVEINGSARYDKYSSGQDAFSPKIGAKFTPIRQLAIRGTFSKGFRIPAFGEANALPTTGYVTNNVSLFNDAYLAQYGCNTRTVSTANPNGFNACPTYIRSGSYGQTTLASPNLKPEHSRSFTAGAVLEPFAGWSFTVDYYNIKKTGAITTPSNAPALLAYYTGAAIPAGYTVIADAPDPGFLTAKPRVAFVQAQLINANTIKVSGIDFTGTGKINLSNDLKLTTSLDVSYILKLAQTVDGVEERYDGTLGNFNLTAGSGTPKWKGYWVNTIEYKKFAITGTVNYFGGYDLSAMDQGTDYKDCGLSDGLYCHVKGYWTGDVTVQAKINDKFTVYGTVLNVLDDLPPYDPVTYGAQNYNPVQGGNGILGRYFKAGVKFAI